jgi:hypothetical protein
MNSRSLKHQAAPVSRPGAGMLATYSEIMLKNLIFETMFSTAKENPTKNAAVSKISFVLSDTRPSIEALNYHRARAAGNYFAGRPAKDCSKTSNAGKK